MMTPSDQDFGGIQPDLVFDDDKNDVRTALDTTSNAQPADEPVAEQPEPDFWEPVEGWPYDDADESTASASASAAEDIEAGELCLDSETGLDLDSPLYGDEDGRTFDWKSVDIHVENDDAPSQDCTDASPDDNNPSDPDHLRSGDGAPCMGLITLKPEYSEHSEQSETSSSNDWMDPGWISPIYPPAMLETLKVRGRPYTLRKHKDGTVTVSKLNECFFAGFVILSLNLQYHNGSWYAYSETSGTWQPLSKAALRVLVNNVFIQFGEKMQIVQIEDHLCLHFIDSVIGYMGPFPGYENIFNHAPWRAINVKNGTVTIGNDGRVSFHEHSPEFLCRGRIEINYNPAADYSGFVSEAFGSYVSQPDISVIQWYAGQCALGRNVSQTFLVISGAAGTGKSQIAKVLELVIGSDNCEGLRTGMLRERFELSRFEGKNLLLAVDECSDALMRRGADVLKALTGDDTITTEVKCQNEHPKLSGKFNVILVSNPDLALSINDDRGAWSRRMLLVKYAGIPPKNIIRDFAKYLLAKYSEGVLNWMVTGAAAVMQNGGKIEPHPEMVRRVEEIIQVSDAPYAFVKNCVVHTGNTDDVLFCFALYNCFTASSYFVGTASKQVIQIKLKQAMKDVYGVEKPRKDLKGPNGKAKYGYVGYRIDWDEAE